MSNNSSYSCLSFIACLDQLRHNAETAADTY